jgi:hypothetical protein
VTISATANEMREAVSPLARLAVAVQRNPTIALGVFLLVILLAMALAAPLIASDPFRQAPI